MILRQRRPEIFAESKAKLDLDKEPRQRRVEPYPYFSQNFSYNTLWQMTGDGVMSYLYAAGHNNGRVSQTFDGAQTVNYGYDTLNRLSSARAADNSWGNVYGYDGFGNLTSKTVAPGAATGMQFSASYDANNHPPTGYYGGSDANGNALTGAYDAANQQYLQYQYDVENRIVIANDSYVTYWYGYDPQNKRVLRRTPMLGYQSPTYSSEFTFYGITGQRLSTFTVISSQNYNSGGCNGARYCTQGPVGGYVYFGGRLILQGGAGSVVETDRLGSQRAGMSYYPWGEEKTATADGQVKFGTYFRDLAGQDYADQRYYTSNAGRYYTPDRAGLSAVDLKNPTSWNKYVYAEDDPVNFNDPTGRWQCNPDDPECNPPCDPEDPTCDPGGGNPGPPLPPPPPILVGYSCTVALEYRPVDPNGRGLNPLRHYNHDYIDNSITETFSDGSTYSYSEVIEGLPQFQNPQRPPTLWGNLEGHIFSVVNGAVVGDPQDHPSTDKVQGKITGGQAVCSDGVYLEEEALNFPTYKYNPVPGLFGSSGENSNFFAWSLLNGVGLNILGAPPSSPGFPGSSGWPSF